MDDVKSWVRLCFFMLVNIWMLLFVIERKIPKPQPECVLTSIEKTK